MEKTFKVEIEITTDFKEDDYNIEKDNRFATVLNDLLNGSRSYSYSFQINREKTSITEI